VSNSSEEESAPRDDAFIADFFARAEDEIVPTHPDYDPDDGLERFLKKMGDSGSAVEASPALKAVAPHGAPPFDALRDGGERGRQDVIFAIDLGTTQSRIAYVDDTGSPVVVRSALGEDHTLSAVFFESRHNVVVGRAARDEALRTPHLVAQLVKRDMGTNMSYDFHGERHTPETVSALILRELARLAAEQTGQEVREVVITVPAYFGIAEREATRRAGELAGLEVLDVLDEPVAAALHYQAMRVPTGEPKHALVYDLGGGTFDTTVIQLAGDDTIVVCTDGDPRLGGTDWDQAIAGYLLGQVAAAHPEFRPAENARFIQDVRISAERLKKELSSVQSRRHLMRLDGTTTAVELTRGAVENLTAGLLERTVAVIDRAIATARGKGVTRFDEVLLVGGMSRFPAVRAALKARLGVDARLHEPELAVVKGAALFARARAMSRGARPSVPSAGSSPAPALQIRRLAAAKVASVLPRAFGIKAVDGRDARALTDPFNARQIILHLLPANTPLPADTGPYTFQTAVENQRVLGIEVWEQAGPEESEDLADNRKVGEGLLRNLPAGLPAGTPFEVTFFMSETGLLTVHAREPRSRRGMRFDFQIGGLDSDRLDEARRSVAGYRVTA
jgi:molecular chaperone DnaK